MSEPEDVTDLALLIAGVQKLNTSVQANVEETKRLAALSTELKTSRARHRIALLLVGFSLAVDLCLTIAVFHLLGEQDDTNARQDCVNHRSQQFFTAEVEKVTGQVKGWKAQLAGERAKGAALGAMLAAVGDRAAGLEAVKAYKVGEDQAAVGLQAAIDKSKDYLWTITSIKAKCS
jgi:hypothetical protein